MEPTAILRILPLSLKGGRSVLVEDSFNSMLKICGLVIGGFLSAVFVAKLLIGEADGLVVAVRWHFLGDSCKPNSSAT